MFYDRLKCFSRRFTHSLALVLSVGALLYGAPSFADDPDAPYISDFPVPAVQPGDLVTADDGIDFTDGQAAKAQLELETNLKQVLLEIDTLYQKLETKTEQMILELGARRIDELKRAYAMPERTYLEKKLKNLRLKKLNSKAFEKFNLESFDDLKIIGKALFMERVTRGLKIEDFRVTIEGLGHAEPTTVDGKLVPRIVHEHTGVAVFILQKPEQLGTVHWERYLARVKAFANRGKGRPPLIMLYDNVEADESAGPNRIRYKFFDTPKTRKEKFANWWKAVYVAPDKQAYVQSVISTVLQVGSTELLAYTAYKLGITPTWDHTYSYLTAGYASFFTLFGSTYNNITTAADPHNTVERYQKMLLRMAISSLTFTYSAQIINHGFHSISLLTAGGRLTNGKALINSFVNNAVKDKFKERFDIRDKMGLSRGTFTFLNTEMKKGQMERTLGFQIPNTLKNADLLMANQSFNLVSWLFYSAIVYVPITTVWHARANNYDEIDKLPNPVRAVNQAWDFAGESFHFMTSDPKRALPALMSLIAEAIGSKINQCKELLTKAPEEVHTMAPPFEITQNGEWVEAIIK